jgi:hypothetical protein
MRAFERLNKALGTSENKFGEKGTKLSAGTSEGLSSRIVSVADATGAQVDSFSSDELIFIVFTNSDTKYCRFDISGENAVLVDTTTDFIVVDGYERFNTSNDINSFTESVNLCK